VTDRRTFIVGAVGAFAAPLATEAQQATKVAGTSRSHSRGG
jgi:hypothetical protein